MNTRLVLAVATWLLACESLHASDVIDRRVAVTFDDLPVAGSVQKSAFARRNITLTLLQSLAARNIPSIGFVNEGKMYIGDRVDPAQADLLRLWLAAGFDLGNHGFAHLDLNDTPLSEFEEDVLRGEKVIEQLLAKRQKTPEFFRHPFLHTGTELEKRAAFERFLSEHGYKVAPVTIDNSEWIFARAYDLAVQHDNLAQAKQIGQEYVDYMLQMFSYYEVQSQHVFERNINHVLLVHANELNSAWFGTLADRLTNLGYEFISLQEALLDPAYASADTYIGAGGITWIHRWGKSRGLDSKLFAGEPQTPPHILQLTGLREHSYLDDVSE
ncbi:MAG: polysaccharide deacetylase family protein [Woeseiaceae bacterium]